MNEVNQTEPKVVNVAEIIDRFVDGDKAQAKEAYELMGTPSDFELDLFDGLDKKTLPVNPAGLVGVASKKSDGRTKLVSASRFCAYGPSIIVMKVTDATTQKIDSFSIFADEGDGWKPIVFQTQSVADLDAPQKTAVADVVRQAITS